MVSIDLYDRLLSQRSKTKGIEMLNQAYGLVNTDMAIGSIIGILLVIVLVIVIYKLTR
ncbi:MAG: hypothetical protein OEM52_04015 [bacterium]|nr:hypothetical protein [bacterium]